ncbi:hypothetical protein ACP275_10G079200 [Erythranthe tilingii]
MEVPGMDEVKKAGDDMAFHGGIQDPCEDACSICLEAFCANDPSTVTICKHEFHLHCILEWCQRSSNCPMCWQSISLKDPTSQELLEAVERERSIRFTPSRNATVFHQVQHLPVGLNDSELEDRIIQHLVAAASMGRSHHHISRRDPSLRLSSSASQTNQVSTSSSISSVNDNRSHASESSTPYFDSAGPSDFQSFSDTWRSRFNTISMRYKDSISNSTRGWKERLFSRSSSVADIGSEVKREIDAGIATVSRMIERLETRDNINGSGRNNPNETSSNGSNVSSFGASSN